MTQEEVLEAIANGATAENLLMEANPSYRRRFRRLCTSLDNLLSDIQKDFDDAQLYIDGTSNMHLMLGDSHIGLGEAQEDLIADSRSIIYIDGGDW